MVDRIGEGISKTIGDFFFLVRVFLILGLIGGGVVFLYFGLTSFDNSLTVTASAAMALALFAGAMLLIVYNGISGIHRRQEAQTEILEQQTVYMKYLAERARGQPRPQETKVQ